MARSYCALAPAAIIPYMMDDFIMMHQNKGGLPLVTPVRMQPTIQCDSSLLPPIWFLKHVPLPFLVQQNLSLWFKQPAPLPSLVHKALHSGSCCVPLLSPPLPPPHIPHASHLTLEASPHPSLPTPFTASAFTPPHTQRSLTLVVCNGPEHAPPQVRQALLFKVVFKVLSTQCLKINILLSDHRRLDGRVLLCRGERKGWVA